MKKTQLNEKELLKIRSAVDGSIEGDVQVNIRVAKNRIKLPPNVMVFQAFAYLAATTLKASTNRILMLLFSIQAYENLVGMDVQTIQEELNLSKPTVVNGLKELESNGIIIKSHCLYDRRRNEYYINPMSAWKGNSFTRNKMIENMNKVSPNQLSIFDGMIESDNDLKQLKTP